MIYLIISKNILIYAYLNYNSSDTRKLTQEEKNRLKLNISVKEGSTDIGIELSDIINKIILNMSPDHTFFVATQAHPEFKSRFGNPNPLFAGFVKACMVE